MVLRRKFHDLFLFGIESTIIMQFIYIAGFIATVKNIDTHSQVDENKKCALDNWLFAGHCNVRDGDQE